jgi:hypothetical protein
VNNTDKGTVGLVHLRGNYTLTNCFFFGSTFTYGIANYGAVNGFKIVGCVFDVANVPVSVIRDPALETGLRRAKDSIVHAVFGAREEAETDPRDGILPHTRAQDGLLRRKAKRANRELNSAILSHAPFSAIGNPSYHPNVNPLILAVIARAIGSRRSSFTGSNAI